ncbi:MAG TPA: NfeD family protein [Bacilli bacterium]|jgi:membrane protein implicated in regulation of membrane protease activity|nr:NfeD family protein [Bacilli bacterium]NLT01263.1 NfeD family protein [Acholeplasmataceae bacterium]HNZ77996.1 NfeD family protein [Bacilli bacterium]HOD61025.1 NfeD family protein [Bacilli bacterium]HOE06459.1 NfeD family protein [Bacilli bacterium]
MEWFHWVMLLIWALIFIITLIIELGTADVTTIWFCLGSLIALICAAIPLDPLIQILVFFGSSIALLFLTKPLTRKMMNKEIIRTNTDKIIGMVGQVTKTIFPDEVGEIKVDNNTWRAICNEAVIVEVGEKVLINAVSGNKAVVSKINDQSNIEIL